MEYTGRNYTEDKEITWHETITEEKYGDTSCWKLWDMIYLSDSGATTSSILHTLYIDKTTIQAIHHSVTGYNMLGNVTYQNEEDINTTQRMTGFLLTQPVDPQSIIDHEDVRVAVGTYKNCAKASFTEGNQTVNVWIHPDVAGWGIVKMAIYEQDKLTLSLELSEC